MVFSRQRGLQLLFVVQAPGRISDTYKLVGVYGDGIGANLDSLIVQVNGKSRMVHLGLWKELFASLQKTASISCTLKSQEITLAQSAADLGPHVFGEQQPVCGTRPRNMDEVAYCCRWQRLT